MVVGNWYRHVRTAKSSYMKIGLPCEGSEHRKLLLFVAREMKMQRKGETQGYMNARDSAIRKVYSSITLRGRRSTYLTRDPKTLRARRHVFYLKSVDKYTLLGLRHATVNVS